MKTRLYLDSGDPAMTKLALSKGLLLAGQTTNPSLVVKHPEVVLRMEQNEFFTREEIMSLYKNIVQEISELVTESVSIEVYANNNTTTKEMLEQAWVMNDWIHNAHIKLPTNTAGVAAAEQLVQDGVRVNMTLCFTQAQAAAVASATKGAVPGQVLLSPFIGRLDDKGMNGMSIIQNIKQMYESQGVEHVHILAASLRNRDHLLDCYAKEVDIITSPYNLLDEWADDGFPLPDSSYVYKPGLIEIPYKEIDVDVSWQSFTLDHPLLFAGIDRFATDWDAVLGA